MARRARADSDGGGVNRLGPAKVQRGRTAPSAKQMANEQEEAGFNPAFLLSSRPADFVRKPPSARLMSHFEFRLPTLWEVRLRVTQIGPTARHANTGQTWNAVT
jgi:hypothetical protein